jgi:hypothetical protein
MSPFPWVLILIDDWSYEVAVSYNKTTLAVPAVRSVAIVSATLVGLIVSQNAAKVVV